VSLRIWKRESVCNVLITFKIELNAADIQFKKLEYSVKADRISVKLSLNDKAPELNYSDFSKSLIQGDDFTTDHSVRTFLEMVTSDYLIAS
jgi:hypothetical protein